MRKKAVFGRQLCWGSVWLSWATRRKENKAKEVEHVHLVEETDIDENHSVSWVLSSDPGLMAECISDLERICLSKTVQGPKCTILISLLIPADVGWPKTAIQEILAKARKFTKACWCILLLKTQIFAFTAILLQQLQLLLYQKIAVEIGGI